MLLLLMWSPAWVLLLKHVIFKGSLLFLNGTNFKPVFFILNTYLIMCGNSLSFTFGNSQVALAISGLECFMIKQHPDFGPKYFLVLSRNFFLSFMYLTMKVLASLLFYDFASFWTWSPNFFSKLLVRWGWPNQALFYPMRTLLCEINNPLAPSWPSTLIHSFEELLLPHLLPQGSLPLSYHIF